MTRILCNLCFVVSDSGTIKFLQQNGFRAITLHYKLVAWLSQPLTSPPSDDAISNLQEDVCEGEEIPMRIEKKTLQIDRVEPGGGTHLEKGYGDVRPLRPSPFHTLSTVP